MVNKSNFQIGIITKPQGIRGELKVLPTTDDLARFELLIGKEVLLRQPEKEAKMNYPETKVISGARVQKNMVYLKFEGLSDREAAEKLVGAAIAIPSEMALPLELDEYYVRDLIGLRAEDESGEALGELGRVIQTSANDIYEIVAPDSKTFLVPAVKEFVKSIDMAKGKVVLRLIEGLR